MDEKETESISVFWTGMSEHITELRTRLIWSVLALAAGCVIAFFFAEPLMAFLARPIGGLSALQSIEITENFSSAFHVSLLGGVLLACPIIFYHLLAFVFPGLKENERKQVVHFLPSMIFLFFLGVIFAFFILLPTAIPFLTQFLGIRTVVRTGSYFSFATGILFWIGVVFEMPVVLFVLTKAQIVSSALLLRNWRQAIVVCAVIAMVITPTVDPINMALVMVPLILLFFVSVFFSHLAEKQKKG